MNRAPVRDRAQALALLLEGMSLRATARVTGLSLTTVKRLIVHFGPHCRAFHNKRVVGLKPRHVQCDELWSFCYAKSKQLPLIKGPPHDVAGDLWTWIAIDEDTKLLISYWVGDRSTDDADIFMGDLSTRVSGDDLAISTDAYGAYSYAIRQAFPPGVDHIKTVKVYDEVRARELGGSRVWNMEKNYDGADELGTSHVERHNLTLRMHNKRYARRSNGYSKKRENHMYQTAIYAVWYNWIRPHTSLVARNDALTTPAMEAGLAKRPFTLEELVVAVDTASLPGPRGPYGPRPQKPEQASEASPLEVPSDSVLVRVVRPDF